jgi:hypothetical protein
VRTLIVAGHRADVLNSAFHFGYRQLLAHAGGAVLSPEGLSFLCDVTFPPRASSAHRSAT